MTAAIFLNAAAAAEETLQTVQSDPIRCWWKTDRAAVKVGERFVLTLTCSVIEAGRVIVVPDHTRLEPSTVQLAPFEVLDGVRHQDIKAGIWRHFQYEYTLRLIQDNFFRQDVEIPSLDVPYNVQMTEGAVAQQGRDQKSVLPPLPIRIHSLVPKDTTDIRDASDETFGDIEARSFRATSELIAAAACFGFSALLLALAVVHAFARVHARTPVASRTLPNGSVVRACVRETAKLKSVVARTGWTPEAAARALWVLRIASAIALSKAPAQTLVAKRQSEQAGQLVLQKGWLQRKRVAVSAPTSAESISRRLAAYDGTTPDEQSRAMLEALRAALIVFSAACYGRDTQSDRAILDRALEQGSAALRQLRLLTLWPRWTAGASVKPATPLEGIAWSR